MASEIVHASTADNLRYNLFHVIPYLLRGVFTRNRRWVKWLTRLQRDPMSVRFLERMRDKYASDFLAMRMLTDRVVIVFDHDAVRHILDHSPALYAETKGKRRGMSHFQPNALTISRGSEWADRRRFNIAVLQPSAGSHPHAADHLSLVRRAVDHYFPAGAPAPLRWADLSRLFETVTLQIVFGDDEQDFDLTAALHAMMLEANHVIRSGRKSRHFDAFYRKLASRLATAPEGSLAALCRRVPSTAETCIANQIPHWMFATADTLAVNTAGALALISAHPEAETRIRSEMTEHPPSSAANIQRLVYLEGCVQEAMRLWPSTLLLLREALQDDRIGNVTLKAGTQVMIHNGFHHRDRARCEFADRFNPDFWMGRPVDYRFNHFSNGGQSCVGKPLALFIATAVLGSLLLRNRVVLNTPRLQTDRPLPYAFDHFSAQWTRIPLDEEGGMARHTAGEPARTGDRAPPRGSM